MKSQHISLALLGVLLLHVCGNTGDGQVVLTPGEGRGGGVVWGAGGAGFGALGAQGPQLEPFMMTLAQLNMTPDFTLDKAAKQKLHEIADAWQAARARFMEDHKVEFQQLNQDRMDAMKVRDQDKLKAIAKRYEDVNANAPKADEYLARAKAVLMPEQLNVVEETMKKNEEQRQAMMEKWRARVAQQEAAPGAPANPGN